MLHGRDEIGRVAPSLLADRVEGPRLLLLGDRIACGRALGAGRLRCGEGDGERRGVPVQPGFAALVYIAGAWLRETGTQACGKQVLTCAGNRYAESCE